MTPKEHFEKFEGDFAKLKGNRAKVPMEQLITRYAKAYNALVQSVEEYAEWFIEEYLKSLQIRLHPNDEAGNGWLQRKITKILESERQPGGLYRQARDALVEDLDYEKFEGLVWNIQERLMKEAYDPYQQRFNKWVGEPGNRWIYNRLFGAFWRADPECEDGGYWIDSDGKWKGFGYPPKLAPPPQK